MKEFICHYPNCDYKTSKKSLIDHHHIIPKHLGGSNRSNNIITLCPNHHRKILVPNSLYGMHKIKQEGSIIIKNIFSSNHGKILSYINCDDLEEKELLYCFKLRIHI